MRHSAAAIAIRAVKSGIIKGARPPSLVQAYYVNSPRTLLLGQICRNMLSRLKTLP
jgi:hypothetical protein